MQFRKDINGLRALAVIGVVLFHFNAAWMPGGFAGVDVFFVISGFLMTGIIFGGLERQDFSILKFYIARANRIIPALAVLCLILLTLGWFYLNPVEYKALGMHATSSVGFFSNLVYWRESGYFDAASREKWLLHTWSLSAEWQFYIIYPAVLVAIRNFMSIRAMKAFVLLGTIFGFIFCVIATSKWPVSAYYLLPARVWEMMFGGVAFLYPLAIQNKAKKIAEWAGLVLILGSFFYISDENPWPGYLALFPVVGTFLIIQSQRCDSAVTSNLILQKLGAWSYSIYLWHWPLVVVVYSLSLNNAFLYLGVMLSVVCGFISNKYIERIKFGNSFPSFLSHLKSKPIVLMMVVGLLGIWVYSCMPNRYLSPLPDRILESIQRKEYKCFNKDYQHEMENITCKLSEGQYHVLALGDSHMYSLLPVLYKHSAKNDISLSYVGFSGCPPLINVYPVRADQNVRNCHSLNIKALDFARNQGVDLVFLAARWTYYIEGDYDRRGVQYLTSTPSGKKDLIQSINAFKNGVELTLRAYSEAGVKVVLMLQVPMQEKPPLALYYGSIINKTLSNRLLVESSVELAKHVEFQNTVNTIILNEARKFANIIVIDPKNYFCMEGYCPVGDGDNSFYFDDDHLSIFGSYKLMPLLEENMNF